MLAALDRLFVRLSNRAVLFWSVVGVGLVALIDYSFGHEIAFSIFYLAPVALSAWYAGRASSIGISLLACVSWLIADSAAGHEYSNDAIQIWNALVRLGFFLITALLLDIIRQRLLMEQQRSRTDSLTGLLNAGAFIDRLDYSLAFARRQQSILTLAYIDLDDFKRINDLYGHNEGDRVLRSFGHVLTTAMRDTDTAARLGGDEFAVILPNTDSAGAQEVLHKFRLRMQAAFAADPSASTCSIGVVSFLVPPANPASAIRIADRLMYKVKRQGKNAVAFRVVDSVVEDEETADLPSEIRLHG